MDRFSHGASLVCALLALVACGKSPPRPVEPAAAPKIQAAGLASLLESYWADNAALMPWYSWGAADALSFQQPVENIAPQSLADSLAIERRYLAAVLAIPRAGLAAQARLSYDIFRRERALSIEGFTYPAELMPVDPDGMPQQFALMAAASERLAASSPKDYEQWRARVASFVGWSRQAVANLRDGLRRGYTVPRVVVEKTLPQLATLGADNADNPFYQALDHNSGDRNAPSEARRERLAAAVRGTIKDEILPAFRAFHDFLRQEYLARARASVGLSALPLGDAWYAYLLRRTTDGAATAGELHSLGVAEVERVQQKIKSLLADAAFAGDAQAFFDRMRNDPRNAYADSAAVLAAYQDIKMQVDAAVPALFAPGPRADVAILPVENYRAAWAPALSYRPRPPNGMLPAALFVAVGRPGLVAFAAYLREAVPGHHYQIELQRERAELPRFRRFGMSPAFVAGWGLYAASLGEELGLSHDSEARFAALVAQLECAAGLVADTGLHAQSWGRQQALDYFRAQVPMDPADAVDRVDRIIAHPAAAAACTVGFLKIQSLRSLAQQRQGRNFEPRGFHAALTADGAMPLDILDEKIRAWLDAPVEVEATPAATNPPGGNSR